MSRWGARCFDDFSDRISFKIKTGDIEEKKKRLPQKCKQTDVSVQPTGKWIRRISQSESAISFSYVIINLSPEADKEWKKFFHRRRDSLEYLLENVVWKGRSD